VIHHFIFGEFEPEIPGDISRRVGSGALDCGKPGSLLWRLINVR
jgi:hypothetical protein